MSVAVVIPAFNRPRRLRRAVESVLGQNHRDFTLAVVDDASTADLSEVRSLVEKKGHRWLRFEENRGPSAARNAGAAAVAGQWIAFLDSDDCWRPGKLERQLAWHAMHPEIAISQCEEAWFRHGVRVKKPDHLRQPDTGRVFEDCTQRCCISTTAAMMTRTLWDRFGGFDERYWTCEDYELWLRISLTHAVGLVPGDLVEKHGGHPDQMSYSFRAIDRWRVLALMERLAAGLPGREREWVLREIAGRAKILADGAKKRALSDQGLYREVHAWADGEIAAEVSGGLPGSLLEKVRAGCLGEGNPQLPQTGKGLATDL